MHLLQHLDLVLFHTVNDYCGNWLLDHIVAYSQRNQLLNGGLMLAAYWWFWFGGTAPHRRASRRRVIEALLGVFIALTVARLLAASLPFRMRPMYVSGIGYHPPAYSFPMNLENWSSFPSDTAALFFALSFGLYRLSRPVGTIAMLWTAGWICLPRLFLGIHYPSDLVAGAAIGIIAVWGMGQAMQVRGAMLGSPLMAWIDRVEGRWPQAFYAVAFVFSFEIAMIFNDVRGAVRGVMHVLRRHGYAGLTESGALLVTGGGILLLGLLAVLVVVVLRRRRGARGAAEAQSAASDLMPQG